MVARLGQARLATRSSSTGDLESDSSHCRPPPVGPSLALRLHYIILISMQYVFLLSIFFILINTFHIKNNVKGYVFVFLESEVKYLFLASKWWSYRI